MKIRLQFLLTISRTIFVGCSASSSSKIEQKHEDIYSLSAETIDGKLVNFDQFRGKVLLIANISLKCGTTPQLRDLQALYELYRDKNFTVIGFPSDDFTGEIINLKNVKAVSENNFGVTFPLFSQVNVKGNNKHELFNFLTTNGSKDIRGEVGFNMEKFIIDRDGRVVARYGPFTNPMSTIVRMTLDRLLEE